MAVVALRAPRTVESPVAPARRTAVVVASSEQRPVVAHGVATAAVARDSRQVEERRARLACLQEGSSASTRARAPQPQHAARPQWRLKECGRAGVSAGESVRAECVRRRVDHTQVPAGVLVARQKMEPAGESLRPTAMAPAASTTEQVACSSKFWPFHKMQLKFFFDGMPTVVLHVFVRTTRTQV